MDYRDQFTRERIQVLRLSGWKVALVAAVVVALILALAIVAAGAFLIILPVVLAIGFGYRLWSKLGWGRQRPPHRAGPTVIDAEYVIVPPENGADRRLP